MSPDRDA